MTGVRLEAAKPGRSLISLLSNHRWRLFGVAFIFIVKDSPLWLLPVITARAVDTVVDGGSVGSLLLLGGFGAAILVQVYPMHMVFVRVYLGLIRSLGAELRNALSVRLQTLSIGYHGRTSAAVIQSKVVRDVESIEMMFGQAGNALGSASIVFVGAVTMTAINVPQFLPIFALTIPCGVIVWGVMRNRSRRRNEELRLQMEQLSRRVGEMAMMMPITRAHGLEHVSHSRVAADAEGARQRGLNLDIVTGQFHASTWVVMQLLSLVCLILAAIFAVTQWMSISAGNVVLLGTYFATLTGTVLTMLGLMPVFTRARESVRSLAEIMEEPDLEQNEGKSPVDEVAGGFRFEGVAVAYPGESAPALQSIDLEIEPGETVALVGHSGSGKSTLVNTLLGLVRPTAGRILLDGRNLNELDLRSVRRAVSVVPQESVLFEGSIYENVTYGMADPAPEEVRDALVRANAWEVVEQLQDGWDTVVGERGTRLSGGERQRISVARALIRDPRILILDEATSALDSVTERKVQEALDRLMVGRTTIIIAHRLSTVKRADRVVVLERGGIAEVGTHEELLRADGRYAQLWRLQDGA